jgi:hypothetical protein
MAEVWYVGSIALPADLSADDAARELEAQGIWLGFWDSHCAKFRECEVKQEQLDWLVQGQRYVTNFSRASDGLAQVLDRLEAARET